MPLLFRWLTVLVLLATRLGAWSDAGADREDQGRRQLRKTQDTKDHPGIVELSPDGNSTFHLIRCRNYASAYSACWLSPVDFVLRAMNNDRATLEWHSHNLYLANQGGAYKLEEHFS